MSRLAAALASTAGGRSGTFATFGNTRTLLVLAATTDSSVQASRWSPWYGWSCTLTRSRPSSSVSSASRTASPALSAAGGMNVPNSRSWP
jgi:hypothetical protein